MECDPNFCPFFRPTAQLVAPATIEAYVGQTVNTYITGYGRVTAYVLGYDPNTGMVRLILLTPYGQQYTQVYYNDMYGIGPAIGGGYPGGGFPGGGGGFPGGAGGFPGGAGGFPGGPGGGL